MVPNPCKDAVDDCHAGSTVGMLWCASYLVVGRISANLAVGGCRFACGQKVSSALVLAGVLV